MLASFEARVGCGAHPAQLSANTADPLLLAAFLLACACSGENRTFPERSAYQSSPPPELSCRPNLDGKIEPSELKAALGTPVSYLISPAGARRTVDVAGSLDSASRRVWEWSTDLADDQVARLSASSLSGKWYAASFPTGQFVAPLDAGGQTEAVYAQDSAALWLLGFASASELPAQNKSLLLYSQPVAIYRFPIQVGGSWVSAGEVRDGTLRGLPYAGRDTYQVSVDASGRLELPDLTFTQAYRTRTKVTVEPSIGVPISRRQVSFLFECFGEVARAVSLDDEPKDDFTTAAEVRRLGL
ncbi:MAG: hypothetical protein HYZ28_04775 [Myxococcales bacterium]|nr:hypothetical protein [Myxococcales bacterium]